VKNILAAAAIALTSCAAGAQSVAIRDLTLDDGAPTIRLMGYGLVAGLPGTGDRVTGTYGSRQTVQSIVNLLRRFDVEVPPEMLRTRNVAAVLVTAEVSPYLRKGGRFEVHVSSLGDAQSLRGGVLWMTPLVAEAGGMPVAGAQGAMTVGGPVGTTRIALQNVTSGLVPNGGVLEADLPRPAAATEGQLMLREPDISTATRIAAAIDSVLGARGIATVVDPGSITIAPKDSAGMASTMARIRDIRVNPSRAARLVIDARDGTIVAGGDIRLGNAVVSHEGISVMIGDAADSTASRGGVRAAAGASVRDLAAALQASRVNAAQAAAIFSALRDAGALVAEVIVR
jgi:flagellar P-ring protein precursor FlgI